MQAPVGGALKCPIIILLSTISKLWLWKRFLFPLQVTRYIGGGGVLYVEHTYSNPIVNTFVLLLVEKHLKKLPQKANNVNLKEVASEDFEALLDQSEQGVLIIISEALHKGHVLL